MTTAHDLVTFLRKRVSDVRATPSAGPLSDTDPIAKPTYTFLEWNRAAACAAALDRYRQDRSDLNLYALKFFARTHYADHPDYRDAWRP